MNSSLKSKLETLVDPSWIQKGTKLAKSEDVSKMVKFHKMYTYMKYGVVAIILLSGILATVYIHKRDGGDNRIKSQWDIWWGNVGVIPLILSIIQTTVLFMGLKILLTKLYPLM